MKIFIRYAVMAAISLAVAISAAAQEYVAPPVKISEQKVKIDGKVYYSHIVEERQTVYSICKAYNVSQEELFAANPGLKQSGLKKNAIINIPVAAPHKEEVKDKARDEKPKEAQRGENADVQKIHTVRWYEGLSDIAAKYGVSVEAIKAANGLKDSKLKNRQKLVIPTAEYAETLIADIAPAQEAGSEAEEEDMDIESAFDDRTDSTETVADPVEYMSKNRIEAIALLPLKASGNTSSRSNMDFYSGILMAVRELGKAGINVELDVHDISNGSFGATKHELENCDVVIGPVNAGDITKLYSLAPGIKALISPLDPKAESLVHRYSTMIHAPAPRMAQYEDMAQWIREDLRSGDRVLVISEKEARTNDEGKLMKAAIDSAGIAYTSFSYSILDGRNVQEPIKSRMTADGVNRVVVASESEAFVNDVVRNINLTILDEYDVVLYGAAKIRTFETIEIENFHNANLHSSLTYYIDYEDDDVKDFIMKYRALFKTEPTQFAFQGYDVARHFLGLCAKYGDNWMRVLEDTGSDMLQSHFKAERTASGGFSNSGIRRIEYKDGYSIKVIR